MDKAAIIYWSGTGNTEAMAKAIADGCKQAGGEVDLFEVAGTDASGLSNYGKLAFGCPSMGDEVLEESEFEPFFETVEGGLAGKKVALFGSYGWGDGQWMREWVKRTEADGANLMDDGLIVQETPEEAVCKEYGKRFAGF